MTTTYGYGYNSDSFKLTNSWYLTVPIDSSGGTSGTATTVRNLTNYSSPYFYAEKDRGMTFTASVGGATTSGSHGARSELREMNGSSLAAWTLKTGGTMTATLKIDSVPTLASGGGMAKEAIGQIHGSSNELIRLYFDNGTVYFKNDKSGTDNKEHQFLLKDAAGDTPKISLGEVFSYKIDAHGNALKVDVYADGKDYSSTTPINSYWATDKLYFKAGVYLGVSDDGTTLAKGKGYGQDTFYGLDYGHVAGGGLGGLLTGGTSGGGSTGGTSGGGNTGGGTGGSTGGVTVTVTGTSGSDTLSADPVKDSVVQGLGGYDTITGHDGDDKLYGGAGNDTIHGNGGADYISGGTGTNKLYGGDGADTFVFKAGEVGHFYNTVGDFSSRAGDKLDVSDMLKDHYNPLTSSLSAFVRITHSGAGSILSVDMDGKGTADGWTKVATLTGASVSTDVLSLVHSGTLMI